MLSIVARFVVIVVELAYYQSNRGLPNLHDITNLQLFLGSDSHIDVCRSMSNHSTAMGILSISLSPSIYGST
jgi:hypothetical protein